MRRTRYRFLGQWDGRYHWESVTRVPGDSRSERVSCGVAWFWNGHRARGCFTIPAARMFLPNTLVELPEPGILFTRDNAAWAYHALKAARETGQSVPEQDELCDELAGLLFPQVRQ